MVAKLAERRHIGPVPRAGRAGRLSGPFQQPISMTVDQLDRGHAAEQPSPKRARLGDTTEQPFTNEADVGGSVPPIEAPPPIEFAELPGKDTDETSPIPGVTGGAYAEPAGVAGEWPVDDGARSYNDGYGEAGHDGLADEAEEEGDDEAEEAEEDEDDDDEEEDEGGGEYGGEDKEIKPDSVMWLDLTPAQRAAAQVLDYSKQQWDNCERTEVTELEYWHQLDDDQKAAAEVRNCPPFTPKLAAKKTHALSHANGNRPALLAPVPPLPPAPHPLPHHRFRSRVAANRAALCCRRRSGSRETPGPNGARCVWPTRAKTTRTRRRKRTAMRTSTMTDRRALTTRRRGRPPASDPPTAGCHGQACLPCGGELADARGKSARAEDGRCRRFRVTGRADSPGGAGQLRSDGMCTTSRTCLIWGERRRGEVCVTTMRRRFCVLRVFVLCASVPSADKNLLLHFGRAAARGLARAAACAPRPWRPRHCA